MSLVADTPRVVAPPAAVSIIVPAYNEEDTLARVLDRLLRLPIHAQVIVVDDASSDGTARVAASFADRIVLLRQPRNRGKGAAIRAGIEHATGQVIVIQDADLEYVPEELPALVEPILSGSATVVYGNRFSGGMHPDHPLPNRIVNRLLSWAVLCLYFRRVPDEATCYKAFDAAVLREMHLVCERFEFCPEVTAKAIRLGHRIQHVPISYHPRNHAEGKKIRWTDGVEAFWTLLRHRVSRFKRKGQSRRARNTT